MNNTQIQGRIIKADKRIRKLVILAYIITILVMVVLLTRAFPWGEDRLGKLKDPAVVLRIIQIVIAFIFLSIVPFGLYMCRFGWQVIKHKQMPPPGTKVIMDTKLIEGEKAVTCGKLIIVISLLLIVLGLYGGLYFPYKLGKVFGEQIRQQAPQTEQAD